MYIPSKLDFSDLADILAFFRGSPKQPDLMFDGTAKALAHNGKCFVERMFRLEDLQAYMFRLFLEYARIVADDDEDMDFHYDPLLHEPVDHDVSGENGDDEDDEAERVDRAPFLGAEDVLGAGVGMHTQEAPRTTATSEQHTAPSRTPRPLGGLNGKVTTTGPNTPPGEGARRGPESSAASLRLPTVTDADAEATTDPEGDHIIPFDQAMAELEQPPSHASASASALAHDPTTASAQRRPKVTDSDDDAEEDDDFM